MSKTALITGITGQVGSYLAELLLSKNYTVHGLVRHSANPNYHRINHILPQIGLVQGDLTDHTSLVRILETVQPNEIYNLAAQSFVGLSWQQPILTSDITGMGVLNLLEAVRQVNPKIKMYQASSSEMFGKVLETPQTEVTPFYPRSPYGVAKVFAHHMAVNYRESFDIPVSCGIMFNTESPRRGEEFVTRKITKAVARIKLGLQDSLALGNLKAQRDWSYTGDSVQAMWLMLQNNTPKDYVISTGETHSVEKFVKLAFEYVGLNFENYVTIDPKFFRPAEVDLLIGDYSLIKKELGWTPKVKLPELVSIMVENDLKLEKK